MVTGTPTGTRRPTTAIPYLCTLDTARAIAFYVEAFGATETMRLLDSEGRVSHAQIMIGEGPIMISDEFPAIDVRSPATIGGSPVMIVLDVPDVDAVFNRAVAAGATVARPLADQFDGALRNGKLVDPFGHRWMISTTRRPEDMAPEKLRPPANQP